MSGPIKSSNDAEKENRQLIINGIVEYSKTLANNRIKTKKELEDLIDKLMSGNIDRAAQVSFPAGGDMAKFVDVLNDYIKVGMVYNEKQFAAILPAIINELEHKGLTFPESRSSFRI